MSALPNPPESQEMVIRMPKTGMNEDQFFEFCQVNDDWQIERTAEGEILIMSPSGGRASRGEVLIFLQLNTWAESDDRGVAFGSSTGFRLPNGAIRAPDAAWATKSRLASLTEEEQEKFLPLCPDFVVEYRSPSDRLPRMKAKMEEYIANGAKLGWLIDRIGRRAFVYRPDKRVEELKEPATLSGDPELPGFLLDLANIWTVTF